MLAIWKWSQNYDNNKWLGTRDDILLNTISKLSRQINLINLKTFALMSIALLILRNDFTFDNDLWLNWFYRPTISETNLSIYKVTLKNYILFVYFFPLTVKITPVWIINYIVMWLKQMSILNVCCFNSVASFLASDGDSQPSLLDFRNAKNWKVPANERKIPHLGNECILGLTLHPPALFRLSRPMVSAAVPAIQLSQVTPKEINGFLKVYFDNYVAFITCL